jgi:hypothetical protein
MKFAATVVLALATAWGLRAGLDAQRGPAKPEAPRAALSVGNDCRPPTAKLEALARKTRDTFPDDAQFLRALDLEVALSGDDPVGKTYSVGPVAGDNDVTVLVIFPYMLYRNELSEAIRKKEPLNFASAPRAVTINVSPETIHSPDIVKIVVERGGVQIRPIANLLKPTVFTTAFGASFTRNAGMVLYPCSAFAPGADVVVTAIPQTGSNYVVAISSDDLKRYR